MYILATCERIHGNIFHAQQFRSAIFEIWRQFRNFSCQKSLNWNRKKSGFSIWSHIVFCGGELGEIAYFHIYGTIFQGVVRTSMLKPKQESR